MFELLSSGVPRWYLPTYLSPNCEIFLAANVWLPQQIKCELNDKRYSVRSDQVTKTGHVTRLQNQLKSCLSQNVLLIRFKISGIYQNNSRNLIVVYISQFSCNGDLLGFFGASP